MHVVSVQSYAHVCEQYVFPSFTTPRSAVTGQWQRGQAHSAFGLSPEADSTWGADGISHLTYPSSDASGDGSTAPVRSLARTPAPPEKTARECYTYAVARSANARVREMRGIRAGC